MSLFKSLFPEPATKIVEVPRTTEGIQIVKKSVGDTLKVHLSISNAQPHTFVGCNLLYPFPILAPQYVTPGQSQVKFEEGKLYAELSFETLVSGGSATSLEGNVVISKALKTGNPVTQDGRVCTVLFTVAQIGSGFISLADLNIGYIGTDGQPILHQTAFDQCNFSIEEVAPPVNTTVLFFLVVE